MSVQRFDLYRATPTVVGHVNTIHLISQSVTGPPGADGAGVSVATKEGGTTKVAVTTVLDFDGTNFDVTGSSGTASIVIAAGQYDPAGTAAALVDDLSGVTNAATARTNLGLGTAATTAASDYATAAQGSTADTAVQPARSISTTAPLTGGGDLSANRTLAVSAASDTAAGVVELATSAETITGTDAARAVTPAGAAAAYVPKALVDAKGDLIVASAADTPARLAVGTNGHVLTADSAEATGVKWAAAAGGGSITTDTAWAAKGDLIAATGNDAAAVVTVGTNGTGLVADSNSTSGVRWRHDSMQVGTYVTPYTHRDWNTTTPAIANTMWYYPVWVDRRCTVASINIKVTTLEAGASARMGVFSISGRPAYNSVLTLVADYGTVSLATTGVKSATGTTVVEAGWWVVGVAISNHSTVRCTGIGAAATSHRTGGLQWSGTTDGATLMADQQVACGWSDYPNGGTRVSGGMASYTATAWLRSDTSQLTCLIGLS